MTNATCSVDSCANPSAHRGWCTKHYQRWRRLGTLELPERPVTCDVDGCDGRVRARGWCNKHWARWSRNGSPHETKIVRGDDTASRFWSRVAKHPDGCWHWTGHLERDGYGKMYTPGDGGNPFAHRVAYELLVGPIPDGLTIDHLCRVRHCVNPEHLEPVTNAENIRRAAQARALEETP